jgi:phosphomannomutase
MQKVYGAYDYRRVDLAIPTERAQRAVERLKAAPPERLAGQTVQRIDTLDGLKLQLGDPGWILFRASGTEPVLRVYCEAQGEDLVDRLVRAGIARIRSLA